MIDSTTIDLQEHLHNIEEEMHSTSDIKRSRDFTIDEVAMRSERDCTIQCLDICTHVATVVEEQKALMDGSNLGSTASGGSKTSVNSHSRPYNIVEDSLQSCKSNIQSANAQLSKRLQHLSARLNSFSAHPLQANSEHERMAEELESIRQCLNICMQASEEAEKVRVNILEDVTTAEDSRQVLVSTVGDLIAAHRVSAGARSLQCIGQMSDETLQQVSRTHGGMPIEVARSPTEYRRAASETQKQFGRTLGSNNVRTL